ncbi:hypothetical protein [Bdellovibrio sp. HCB337]|uniref:hypothetical protein n=1 Tax=Bdellovibrio sp. HCB337 TaxID=3394358 RepID=UPI0039A4170C
MDDKQLREFSNVHLGKEIYALFGAIELFVRHRIDLKDPLNLCAKTLFLEGIILHTRCLIEFFYFEQSAVSRRKDDVRAADFFADPSIWEQLRPKKPEHFVEFNKRASKEIVHLTHARTETAEIAARWDLYSTTRDLIEILQLFVDRADVRKLDSRVKNDLVSIRRRIEPILEQSSGHRNFK